MSDIENYNTIKQKFCVFILLLLSIIHWVGFEITSPMRIPDSTVGFGSFHLGILLKFVSHSIFLGIIWSNFKIEFGISRYILILIILAMAGSAVSFILTGTILGLSNLDLYEPVMVSILTTFAIYLYLSKTPEKYAAPEI